MKKLVLFSVALLAGAGFLARGVVADESDFGGPEITYKQPVKGVLFSHKSHVGDMGFECEACHDGLFEMEALAVQAKGDFNMKSLQQGKYCGSCHNGETGFSVDTQCSSCHVEDGGDIYYTEHVKSVLFSHKTHGEMGLECDSCHSDLFEMKALKVQENADFTMESLYQGKYCGACHDGNMAFASNTRCASCHVGVKGYMRAKGEEESKKSHGAH